MKTVVRRDDLTGRTYRLSPELLDRAVARAYQRRGARALAITMHAFAIKKAALGRLFGVSRQAVDLWLQDGVPEARVADIERVAAIAQTLRRHFRAERLPSIVRGPLPALAGRSILQTLAADGVRPIYELLEQLTSYVPAA